MADCSTENLERALVQHAIDVESDHIPILAQYCELLWQWNERMNLTRHTTHEKFATRDVLDSVKLGEQLGPQEKILDVGTGGGVPGIILAIVRSDLEVSLCDTVGKKIRAVDAMLSELGISLTTWHHRVEGVLQEAHFDTLVVRAVAPLPKLLGWIVPHRDAFGRLLVIKGPSWHAERQECRERGLLKSLEVRTMSEYQTPGTGAENVILQIS